VRVAHTVPLSVSFTFQNKFILLFEYRRIFNSLNPTLWKRYCLTDAAKAKKKLFDPFQGKHGIFRYKKLWASGLNLCDVLGEQRKFRFPPSLK
jgi:hypothetical protein